jgi:hypothetical protein
MGAASTCQPRPIGAVRASITGASPTVLHLDKDFELIAEIPASPSSA